MPVSPNPFLRPADGRYTHPDHPDWGATGTALLRMPYYDPAAYGAMSSYGRPNPRAISNAIAVQEGDTPNAAGASDFLWIWGQFIDHDMSLTSPGHSETAHIPVPQWDPHFDPAGHGTAEIPFTRVEAHDGHYTNEITAYIDGSMIYGSDETRLAELRTDGGKLLLTEEGNMVRDGHGFMTGDVRAAENVALSSMHTIFAREHNRVVDELFAADSSLTGDQLFAMARARVEATIQAITYNAFLPMLLGKDAIGGYGGYDETVNPGITIEFSTAVFRLGHTLLSANLQRMSEDGTAYQPLALRDAFFKPAMMSQPDVIENLMRGAATQTAQALDNAVVEDVRSFLFGAPGAGGFDLAALNIQRGRDLGIGSYNDLREAVGLARVTSFSEITSDAALAAKLASVYANPDDVDAWVGGLAEDPVNGGLLGETFSRVMIDQFTRLRDGDPYWSEGRADLSDAEKAALWDTTLSDVILRNTDVEALQKDVFIAMNRMVGTDGHDKIMGGGERDFIFGDNGNDKLYGRDGGDDLQGGRGRDKLMGGNGDDYLDGGAGNDMLVGGRGDDMHEGGAGRDRFDFNVRQGGHDTIKDLEIGIDGVKITGVSLRKLDISEVDGELTLSYGRTDWSLTLENLTLQDWNQHGWNILG
ncbi:hypothetical protein FHS00_001417 [Limimaricola variabilis]|uniref:Peroxidase n=1 Tax=Limimaricola variabilis TaxID=1492771 RepID=A0ABR6HMP9_9RHOB|nr:peroxidase family protein [Limimaricola variabilis]MBB3711841.1 hypothetical protein [Limimaricola variabilis]